MALDDKDIAAIACGAFLAVCCAVVMLIHLCRPQLLDRKLREEVKNMNRVEELDAGKKNGGEGGNLKLEKCDMQI